MTTKTALESDDSDLDDLDEILDQFAPPPTASSSLPPTRPAPAPPGPAGKAPMLGPERPPGPGDPQEQIAKELVDLWKQMEAQGGGFGDAPGEDSAVGNEELERLAKMFTGLGMGEGTGENGAEPSPADAEAASQALMAMMKDFSPELMLRGMAEEFPDPDDLPLPDDDAPPPRLSSRSNSTTDASSATTPMPLSHFTTSTFQSTSMSTSTSTTATTTVTTSASTASAAAPLPRPASTAQGAAFQQALSQTLSRLQASDSAATASSSAPADPLADLLGSLGGGSSGEGGGEAGLQGMLEGMMRQLLSKDILYEPLKELADRYPAYLAAHPELSKEDMDKHKAQQAQITDLVRIFEDSSYDEKDVGCGMRVVEGMNRLQELGPPPREIMGDLPEGFDFGEDGLPRLPGLEGLGEDGEGCVIA